MTSPDDGSSRPVKLGTHGDARAPWLLALAGFTLVGLSAGVIQLTDPGGYFVTAFRRLLRDDLSALTFVVASGCLGLLAALLLRGWRPRFAVLTDHPRSVALLTLLVCLLVSRLAYRAEPLAMDEVAPVFQARVFGSGSLAARFEPTQLEWLFPTGFVGVFFFAQQATGRVVSAYWPGMALLLTPFELLGCGFALNPLLAAGSTLLLRYVALHLSKGDRELTGRAMALLVCAPAFVINGASFYSMNAHLFANLAFLALLREPTSRRLLAAGAVGGLALSLHNPLPHLLFCWPWLALELWQPDRLRRAFWLLAGYAPVALLLVVGWYVYVAGLRGAGASMVGASALTALSADVLLLRAEGLAKLVLWTPFALLPLAVLGAWQRRHEPAVRALSLSALSTLAGYAVVKFDQGHGWGYRYFHSAFASLPLLGCLALPGPARSGASSRALWGWCVAGALLLVPQRALQVAGFIAQHRAALVSTPAGKSCVHFVRADGQYSGDLVQNRPDLSGELRLSHHGDAAVRELLARYFDGSRWQAESSTDVAYCGSLERYRAFALGRAPR